MTPLDQFREKIVVADTREIEVFRMDNTRESAGIPDMRKHVGLGSCNCCDYFFIHNNKIVLIEETRLMDTIENLKQDCSYLKIEHLRDFVSKCVRQENYVKVYGALLVLCRLAGQYSEVSKLIKDKKHDFYLVIEGIESEEARSLFDTLRDSLFEQLRSVLTKNVIDKIEVMPSTEHLASRLSEAATP